MDIKDLILFDNLTEEELQKSMVCCHARILEYTKNQYIFHQGDTPHMLYFVLEGTVKLGQVNTRGRLGQIEYIGEGQGVGEIELFLEYPAYTCFAKTESDARLLAVSRHFFQGDCERKCTHHSKIIYNMLQIFAKEAQKSTQKLNLLTRGNLSQRLADYLLQQSKGKKNVSLPMNREELAAYLNTTRPSLSRELANMQQKNILIIQSRSTIKIIDFLKLQQEMEGIR